MESTIEPDDEAVFAARDITSALRYAIVEEDNRDYSYNAGESNVATLERVEKSRRPRRALSLLKKLNRSLAADVELADLGVDLAVFEGMYQIAIKYDAELPILWLSDQEGTARSVPLLYSPSTMRTTLEKASGHSDALRSRMFSTAEKWFAPDQIVFKTRREVGALFFDSFEPFLAQRIAGDRWFRKQQSHRRSPRTSHSGGNTGKSKVKGGRGGPGSRFGGAGNGQWWKVHSGPGLVLYWADRFGVRVPPNSLGGKTTPLDVFLLMGDGFIGADAGPNKTTVWDTPLVSVPSVNPVYTASKF